MDFNSITKIHSPNFTIFEELINNILHSVMICFFNFKQDEQI